MSNPYWENICSLAEKQRSKGIATYGQGLEANPADVVDRIVHLQEELIDALMYCEWIKDTIVPCHECKLYNLEGAFCKFWNGVRHPEHYCGVWKLEATRNVAGYFEEALKDLIETGDVVVIR